jgi:hypothetical protein
MLNLFWLDQFIDVAFVRLIFVDIRSVEAAVAFNKVGNHLGEGKFEKLKQKYFFVGRPKIPLKIILKDSTLLNMSTFKI